MPLRLAFARPEGHFCNLGLFSFDHLKSTQKNLLQTFVGAWQVGLSSDRRRIRRVRRRIRRRRRIHGRLGEALVGELR